MLENAIFENERITDVRVFREIEVPDWFFLGLVVSGFMASVLIVSAVLNA